MEDRDLHVCLLCTEECWEGRKGDEDAQVDRDVFTCFLKSVLQGNHQFEQTVRLASAMHTATHFPFCQECAASLVELFQLQSRLTELEGRLRARRKEIKVKLTAAEASFQASRIYQQDDRYYRIRRLILGEKLVQQPARIKDELKTPQPFVPGAGDEFVGVRRSSRRQTATWKAIKNENYAGEEKDKGSEMIEVKVEVNHEHEEMEESMEVHQAFQDEEEEFLDHDHDYSPESLNSEDGSDDDWMLPGNDKGLGVKVKTKHSDELHEDDLPPVKKKKNKCRKKKKLTDSIRESYSKAKVGVDPVTGNCTYLHMAFENIGENQFKCIDCSRVVNSHNTIKNHVKRVHTDLFVCNQCGQHKASLSDLNKHRREVHEGKTRKPPKTKIHCPICDKPFATGTKYHMQLHKFTHYSEQDKEEAKARGEKVLGYKEASVKAQCDVCGLVCANVWSLKSHEKKKHPREIGGQVEEVQKICPHCGKSLSEQYLKMHIERYHSNMEESALKPFICTVCDKRFYTSQRLELHRVVHTGERPFKCSLCTKDFTQPTLLKIHHDKEHLKITRCPCPLCPKGFENNYRLRRHLSQVHGEYKRMGIKVVKPESLELEPTVK